jgi:hypothetical protein
MLLGRCPECLPGLPWLTIVCETSSRFERGCIVMSCENMSMSVWLLGRNAETRLVL